MILASLGPSSGHLVARKSCVWCQLFLDCYNTNFALLIILYNPPHYTKVGESEVVFTIHIILPREKSRKEMGMEENLGWANGWDGLYTNVYHGFLCHCQVWAPLDSLVLHGSEQRKKHNNSQEKPGSVGPEPESWFPGTQGGTQCGDWSQEAKAECRGVAVAMRPWSPPEPRELGRIQSPGATSRASGGRTGPRKGGPHVFCVW